MRLFALLGFLTLAVARQARAETPEPEEPPIELGPAPPPPPGAEVTEPDEPSVPSPPSPPEDGGVAPTPTAPLPSDSPEAAAPSAAPPPAPPGARKEEPPLPPAPADRPSTAPGRHDPGGWYGWKILIADGGALVLTVAAPLGPVLGAGAYVLTAPAIHLGHHRPLAALGSLTIRIAAPLALNALVEKGPCNADPCVGPGFFAGMALASLTDVIVLAHDSGEPPPKKAERVTPSVAASRKGSALFLTGSF